ncbi:MAG: hypothetical protein RJA36_1455 [Pseudomonadota bacterium]|jgi:hypothetical protein
MSVELGMAVVSIVAQILDRAIKGELEEAEITRLREIAERRWNSAEQAWNAGPPGPAGRKATRRRRDA